MASLVITGLVLFFFAGVFVIAHWRSFKRKRDIQRQLAAVQVRMASTSVLDIETLNELKIQEHQLKLAALGAEGAKRRTLSLEERMYHAGYVTDEDKANFRFFRLASLLVGVICGIAVTFIVHGHATPLAMFMLCVFCGYALPVSTLNSATQKRHDDMLQHLPFTIECISIGVSGSLALWPCVEQVLSIAERRGWKNGVIDLLERAQKLIKSGVSLKDALAEVSESCPLPEVKHALHFLAQCSEHGGEVTRQLQELADTTFKKRQMDVESRIASLPVAATAPLALVFAGFFALLLAGLFARVAGIITGMNSL